MTHTNTTEKAPGACDSKGLTTDTNGVNSLTADDEGKAFKTLVTGFAHTGHTLHQTEAKDGTVTYWAARWGLVRYLPALDDARRFLAQIGGGNV